MTAARVPFEDRPDSQQAGILTGDPLFAEFAARQCGLPNERFNTSATAAFIRHRCEVNSRAQLDTDTAARARWRALRTDFDAFRGRIPQQR